jgi:hypothetical protein
MIFIFLKYLAGSICNISVSTHMQHDKWYINHSLLINFQCYVDDEVKTKLNSISSCYISLQELLLSHLLSKNLSFKTYKVI